MSDYLLLGGVVLGAVSILAALVQLLQSQPPRGSVITLIFGAVLIFAGAYLSPEPFQPQNVVAAWERVSAGTAQ